MDGRKVYITQLDGVNNVRWMLKKRLVLEQDRVHWTITVPDVPHLLALGKKKNQVFSWN